MRYSFKEKEISFLPYFSFSEISNLTNSNNTKSPMTVMGAMSVTITNMNTVPPNYDNVGFLYIVVTGDKDHSIIKI